MTIRFRILPRWKWRITKVGVIAAMLLAILEWLTPYHWVIGLGDWWSIHGPVWQWPLALVIYLLLDVVTLSPGILFPRLRRPKRRLRVPRQQEQQFLLAAGLGAPILEEVVCRWLLPLSLIRVLSLSTGLSSIIVLNVAAVASGIYFVTEHGDKGPLGSLQTFCAHCLLFWVTLTFGLPISILVHGLHNIGVSTLGKFMHRKRQDGYIF